MTDKQEYEDSFLKAYCQYKGHVLSLNNFMVLLSGSDYSMLSFLPSANRMSSLLHVLSSQAALTSQYSQSWTSPGWNPSFFVLLLLQWAAWRDGQFCVVMSPQIHHYILIVMYFSQSPIARCQSLLCPSLEIKLHQDQCTVNLAMWRQIHDRIDWGQRKDPSDYCNLRSSSRSLSVPSRKESQPWGTYS